MPLPKVTAPSNVAASVTPSVPETVALSSIATVPPAESIVKLPDVVSISLSPVIPTWIFPAITPVDEMSPPVVMPVSTSRFLK